MSGPLAGRVALVTGASRRRGVGAAVARRLAADGASVFLHSWAPYDALRPGAADEGGAERLVKELRRAGAEVRHRSADLADPEAPAALVATAREAFGHIDILVTGHTRNCGQSLEELTAAEFDLSSAVNTRATLLLVQAFAAQHDNERPGGRIVLYSSGQSPCDEAEELPYLAAKAARQEVMETLAAHLAPRDITVNSINRGPYDTGGAAGQRATKKDRTGGRWSTPQDTARVIGWLVSAEADWVTGQTIASDGDWSALAGE
ncbi:MAG: SDR family oxidoreductase [Actinocatenispora sp.]